MSSLVVTRRQRQRRRPSEATPLRFFFRFVFYMGLGAAIGLGSAWYLLDRGISLDSVHVGQWQIRTDAGQPIADPYTSAYIARLGHIPMRLEGAMYFFAKETADGQPLRSQCRYLIEGSALSGAWWSISLHRDDGSLVENPAQRYSFSSTTMFFEDNSTYRIAAFYAVYRRYV